MGLLMPIDQRADTSRVVARNQADSASLSRDGHRSISADFDCADRGGGIAPLAHGAARNRSALERLLTSLDPVSAGDNAAALLREFGSLATLFNAAPEQIDRALAEAPGAGAMIAAARDFTREALAQTARGSPVRGNDPALHRYLQVLLGRLPREQLHVVFADSRGGYIADEAMSDGGVGNLGAHLSCLFRRAMTLDAKSILLAHNHPSGAARPSALDIEETRRIGYVGQSLGIQLIDHLIVTSSRVCSMVDEGFA